MKVIFDDIIQEILFELGLKYCYYEDAEHLEISKKINEEIGKLRKELNG